MFVFAAVGKFVEYLFRYICVSKKKLVPALAWNLTLCFSDTFLELCSAEAMGNGIIDNVSGNWYVFQCLGGTSY